MKTVVFNPVAVIDLEEIVGYIARDNAVAAEDVREDMIEQEVGCGDVRSERLHRRGRGGILRHDCDHDHPG